jgi:hypothetical protein
MGRRLGLVTIDPVFIPWHERQVRAHGLGERVAGVRAIHADLPGFMRAFTDQASYAQVRADFVEQVRPLVAAGAEVIIPAGGLPMLLFARECPFVIDGAGAPDGSVTKQSSSVRRTPMVLSTARVAPLSKSITFTLLVPLLPLVGASVPQTWFTFFPLLPGKQPTMQLGGGFKMTPERRITPLGPEPVATDAG